MDLRRVVVVPKLSKYDWDRRTLGLDHDRLLARYREEQVDEERILGSHHRQTESLSRVTRVFGEAQVIQRDELDPSVEDRADLVIALGGDNHFQWVSHQLVRIPILGMNSDPQTSVGVLTPFDSEDTERIRDCLSRDRFRIHLWTRLAATLNGRPIQRATCHYYVGQRSRTMLSRHILGFHGREEEQKCSGILITTGSGSTGWYDSACRHVLPGGKTFPPTSPTASFVVMEPYHSRGSTCGVLQGEIREEEELQLVSLNDSGGIISPDSVEDYDAGRGARITIRIAREPLRVVSIPEIER